ncbi:MAG: PDZ domain-containing protein [Ruminococcaceae bacterium]|nr:PDZ domain-containing protein [Oscillospiraceae bacterium]
MKRLTVIAMLLALCVTVLPFGVSAKETLIPVGQVVGLNLGDESMVIVGFDSILGAEAQKAGLQIGDKITNINGRSIHCTEDILKALKTHDGTADVRYIRDGKTKCAKVQPIKTENGLRLGIYLKQGISGVGTVTWYDPDSGTFGALGHGVNTGNGQLVSVEKGTLYRASVLSVVKGKAGEPGQLIGNLRDKTPIGEIRKNVQQGVFGTVNNGWQGTELPVADNDEIRTGAAVIRSNVSGDQVQEYSVEILKIYPNSRDGGRNMLIKVTDPALLQTTGGIVQGMSGSPIIQNGKLIGAVTHVLVNDPTRGYGIFIENMLDAAA